MTTTRPRPRPLLSRAYAWARTLHLYLSMLSFLAILFFALTGLTLNHPEWFGGERTERLQGHLVAPANPPDLLSMAEELRARHGLRGRVAEHGLSGEEAFFSFRAPGYAADAFVNVKTGAYQLTVTSQGLVGVLNDLHKGRDAGARYGLFLDLSALFLAVVSLTGLLMGLFIRRVRLASLLTLVLGGGGMLVWFFLAAR
ncbi:PepSY-associated TM helix domain-containing protein [Thermus filiformis]|uniref:Peptidase n=1 Tax=Thermus filiformis TaxID=276 RepID=A0A0A2WMS2_THEFI|nr:PepSY-associated TM helix domain-containing protein [Thermus filiformis]KGQ21486.2 peptidase [Thermus filiformis]